MNEDNLIHKALNVTEKADFTGDFMRNAIPLMLPLRSIWYEHALGIALFVGYEMVFVYLLGSNAPVLDFLVYYLLNIPIFYVQAHMVFPFVRTKVSPLFLQIAAVLSITALNTVLSILLSNLLLYYYSGEWHLTSNTRQVIYTTMRSVFFTGAAWAYYLALVNILKTEQNRKLEIDRMVLERKHVDLENAYLHARISPHFLYNTLNMIYTIALVKSEKTASAISTLSDIMHYSLRKPDDDGKVNLKDELENVQRLIRIIELRFGPSLSLKYRSYGDDPKDLRVPPHILMTLVENVLKHGEIQDLDNPARILIRLDNDVLEFKSWNLKLRTKNEKGGGFGLHSTEIRLQTYYEGRYMLHVHNFPETHELYLNIKL